MIYNIFPLIKLALLVSKSLFAIYQKRIFFHFAVFGDGNFCSMPLRLLWELVKMADRGVDCVLFPIYQ